MDSILTSVFVYWVDKLCVRYNSLFFLILSSSQVVTEYKNDQLPMVLDALEKMHAHLTAAVVSNDPLFLQACSVSRISCFHFKCLFCESFFSH